eukprot:1076036-Pleurochrysis_carterae.AAC.1
MELALVDPFERRQIECEIVPSRPRALRRRRAVLWHHPQRGRHTSLDGRFALVHVRAAAAQDGVQRGMRGGGHRLGLSGRRVAEAGRTCQAEPRLGRARRLLVFE